MTNGQKYMISSLTSLELMALAGVLQQSPQFSQIMLPVALELRPPEENSSHRLRDSSLEETTTKCRCGCWMMESRKCNLSQLEAIKIGYVTLPGALISAWCKKWLPVAPKMLSVRSGWAKAGARDSPWPGTWNKRSASKRTCLSGRLAGAKSATCWRSLEATTKFGSWVRTPTENGRRYRLSMRRRHRITLEELDRPLPPSDA